MEDLKVGDTVYLILNYEITEHKVQLLKKIYGKIKYGITQRDFVENREDLFISLEDAKKELEEILKKRIIEKQKDFDLAITKIKDRGLKYNIKL